jgi:hypothetical protein
MALTKNTAANTQTAQFEAPDDDGVIENGAEQKTPEQIKAEAQARLAAAAAQHQASQPKEEAKPSESRAVAPQAGRQVAVTKPMVNPLEPLKDAFPVEWDTLRNLYITNGNVVDRQTNKALGDSIGMELLSFQDQWVVSPGGDDKDKEKNKEFVRYSNDGKTTTQGEDVDDYLAKLLATGFPDAKKSERSVICGALVDIGVKGKKDLPELANTLVQINLPPTSKAAFKRYQMDQAFKIGKGLIEPEGAQIVRIDCDLVTKGDNTWTVANFSRYTA